MFAIWGQSVAFQVVKLGTHENTHESGADAGRLKGVLRDAPDQITRKAAAHSVPAAGMRAASTAFCARMSNLCPYPHRLPVLTDPGGKGELFSIPHTSIRLPRPHKAPEFGGEKKPLLSSV